jgi:hypothetical protein
MSAAVSWHSSAETKQVLAVSSCSCLPLDGIHISYCFPLSKIMTAICAEPRAVRDADILRTMPSKAIELASFDLYKKAFAGMRPKDKDGRRHASGLGVGLAGALAGNLLAAYPVFPPLHCHKPCRLGAGPQGLADEQSEGGRLQ